MARVIKILLVVAILGGIVAGIRYGGAAMDDKALADHVQSVLGPNQMDSTLRKSIRAKASELGVELEPDAIDIQYSEPKASTGPIANKVSGGAGMTVYHVTATATVTYERQILPGFKKKVRIVKSKSYPTRTTLPSRR